MKIQTSFILSALCGVSQLSATLIIPDSANASSEFGASFAAVHTINGSGLAAEFDQTSAHDDYQGSNHWTTSTGDVVGAWIDWEFAAPTDLAMVYIWNHRSNGIAASSGYEPISFDLELFDGSDDSLLLLEGVSLAPDTAFAQAFSFGSLIADVSRVRFTVLETQDLATNFTGLAKVAFSAVPEPSAVGVFLGMVAVCCVAGTRRRARC